MNEATKTNLERKSQFIDNVQIVDGVPLFSWIDINITELCNRTCEFCPRGEKYPNQNLEMSVDLADKIASELDFLNYEGTVVFSGFGESLLHSDLRGLVRQFGGRVPRQELVTNGDFLEAKAIRELYLDGVRFFAVSLYDGPEQVDVLQNAFKMAGVSKEHYILRDRWHGSEKGYGLKLTNRAGTVHIGNQPPVDVNHRCFYTAYSVAVDWNGDVLLCVQDWHKRKVFGNLHDQSLFDIWKNNKDLRGMRQRLIGGRRVDMPCAFCNADGTLHGANHANMWETR